MQITAIASIIAIIGLLLSFFMVGGLISLVSLILGIRLFIRDKAIPHVRIIAISAAGLIVPFIMYINTYGFSLPKDDGSGRNFYVRILDDNYSNFGIDLFKDRAEVQPKEDEAYADNSMEEGGGLQAEGAEGSSGPVAESAEDEDMVYVSSPEEESSELAAGEAASYDEDSIFESLDSISEMERNKGGIISIAASDDDMPSYGGLPVGTLLVGQYFREDDHNCNPVLVLQNKTGDLARYECRFIARSADGDEIAVSEKTVEVVRDGALFVFEGRFDKRDLGDSIPDAYEFSITKRTPYERDMAGEVSVYTASEGASALLTAENKSDRKVKVDAYVLFFDGNELVDCMWMIPQNIDEVCLEPGSAATIRGDAYYRFDRVETFYTAYEAVGE